MEFNGFLDIPLVFLWYSFGIPLVFLWYSFGIPLVFLWHSFGLPLEHQRNPKGIPKGPLCDFVGIPKEFDGIPLDSLIAPKPLSDAPRLDAADKRRNPQTLVCSIQAGSI